ncbi:hypothetical protein GE09DRAFT_373131 [Coniochaeta sp. 2T2.1]|nr:hypothetical protein GE09DRAFT_373131 [Coniochaeta sp. 2T2.1]
MLIAISTIRWTIHIHIFLSHIKSTEEKAKRRRSVGWILRPLKGLLTTGTNQLACCLKLIYSEEGAIPPNSLDPCASHHLYRICTIIIMYEADLIIPLACDEHALYVCHFSSLTRERNQQVVAVDNIESNHFNSSHLVPIVHNPIPSTPCCHHEAKYRNRKPWPRILHRVPTPIGECMKISPASPQAQSQRAELLRRKVPCFAG